METHSWKKSSGYGVESPSEEAFKSNPDILWKQLSWHQQSYGIVGISSRDLSLLNTMVQTLYKAKNTYQIYHILVQM